MLVFRVVSFNLDGNYQDAAFSFTFKIVYLAESLGGVESLVCHPEKMTHASVPEDLRKKLGISESLYLWGLKIKKICLQI